MCVRVCVCVRSKIPIAPHIPGMILEVAIKKCGGMEGFKAASTRGDIYTAMSQNGRHELHFFPSKPSCLIWDLESSFLSLGLAHLVLSPGKYVFVRSYVSC